MKTRASVTAVLFSLLLCLVAADAVLAQATAIVPGPAGSRIKGEFAAEGDTYLVKSPNGATVVFGDASSTNYRVTFDAKFDATKANSLSVRTLSDVPLEYTQC